MKKPWTEIEGIPRDQWLQQCAKVRADFKMFGVTRLQPQKKCEGGYCRRHFYSRPVTHLTEDGLMLCNDCAVLWAVRRHYDLKHGINDL